MLTKTGFLKFQSMMNHPIAVNRTFPVSSSAKSRNLSTKPTETGDRVDYAEIPRFLWWNGSIIGFVQEETGDCKTTCGKLGFFKF